MLINCVAYRDGAKLADIPVERISDHMGQPGCFVWVALRDASDEELAQMQHEFGLHDLAVEDAAHGHQRPKIEEYDDSLFVVLHTLEPAPDATDAAAAIAARRLADGPASQGWVLERIADAVLADDPRTMASLLADLRCDDCAQRVG